MDDSTADEDQKGTTTIVSEVVQLKERGNEALKDGQLDEAIGCYQSALSRISEIIQLKEKGNTAFKQGHLEEAINCYKAALSKFGDVPNNGGRQSQQQRESYVAILSNLSLMYLKNKDYYLAEEMASQALSIEGGGHSTKCLIRRAKARFCISRQQSTPPDGDDGDLLSRLQAAKKDVQELLLVAAAQNDDDNDDDYCEETRKLLLLLDDEIARLLERNKQDFGCAVGFGSSSGATTAATTTTTITGKI